MLPVWLTYLAFVVVDVIVVVVTATPSSSSSSSSSHHRGLASSSIPAEDCMTVQQRCASRLGCSVALSNYMMACGPVVHDQVQTCTRECRNALVTLLSMEDHQGEVFMTCDCSGNTICLEQRRRLEVCHEEVIRAVPAVMDNLTDISCTLAQLICSADTSCYTALNYYNRHCHRLMRGEKCSGKCNNSLTILYSQRKARKLRTCICDGTEEYNCEELRYNTETMCFSRHRPPPAVTTEHVRHHHDTHTRSPPSGHGDHDPPSPVTPRTYYPYTNFPSSSEDKEEDYEDERREEEDGGDTNYTGRRRKKLTYPTNSAPSQTVLWNRGLIWILFSYYLTLFLPLLKFTSSLLSIPTITSLCPSCH